jgi:hypothetical protein
MPTFVLILVLTVAGRPVGITSVPGFGSEGHCKSTGTVAILELKNSMGVDVNYQCIPVYDK